MKQRCIHCDTPFESEDSPRYKENICGECSKKIDKGEVSLMTVLMTKMVKDGGFKSHPSEDGKMHH